ncbi:MAG: ABC transporter ATP-binding protein [Actinobacteria bacterium]|nr:ABC transporter ATP-binding protein [Actinomycetota bacterium]
MIRVDDLRVHYPVGRGGFWGQHELFVRAVDGVSFSVRRGETLGLVGESGSGKTTTGRAILHKAPITSGRVWFKGQDITGVRGEELRRLRRDMQLVFQDPYGSLNPRMRILDIVAEPLVVHGVVDKPVDAVERVAELLELVGLPVDAANRYPHAFSGGQRQRIGIARALALEPEFIIADEPVSALDVSIQAQIVNLLQELQHELGLTYLFIAHDLSVVRHISHRIAIMYAGKLVEIGTRDEIYDHPQHPYTEALLSAVPIPDPPLQRQRKRIAVTGEIPNPMNPPTGCRFHTRCPIAEDRCRVEEPPLEPKGEAQLAACWLR